MSRSGVKLFYDTSPSRACGCGWSTRTTSRARSGHLLHDADPTKWMPHRDVSEQYCLEMASESLVKVKGKWVWKPNGTARNEAWDCEVLQRAAAEMFNVASAAPMAEAEDRFYKWLETATSAGKASASGPVPHEWREPRKDGDGGFLLLKRGGYPRLQYIPGDLIRNPYKGFDFRTMFDGVECDPAGRPMRFWIRDVTRRARTRSPDRRPGLRLHRAPRRPARRARGDGLRPDLRAARPDRQLPRLGHQGRDPGLHLRADREAAEPGGGDRALGTMTNSQGDQQKAITLENGMLKVMGTDESVFQVQASQPMQQTPEFMRALSASRRSGSTCRWRSALRDLSQVNFSGGQLGMKGYERTCRVRQDWLKSRAGTGSSSGG
jgi:hypothetical protein